MRILNKNSKKIQISRWKDLGWKILVDKDDFILSIFKHRSSKDFVLDIDHFCEKTKEEYFNAQEDNCFICKKRIPKNILAFYKLKMLGKEING